MTARTSMASLITTVRGFTNAGTADFTDAQIQTVLDRYANILRDAALSPVGTMSAGGTTVYLDYTSPARWLESTLGGTAGFVVSNGLGGVQAGTLWSADYEIGQVTFVTNQAGSARYITARSYDVFAAAGDIWQQKAAIVATMIDFSTLGQSVKRSHIVAQCNAMAKYYQGMATSGGASSGDVDRGDRHGQRAMEYEHD